MGKYIDILFSFKLLRSVTMHISILLLLSEFAVIVIMINNNNIYYYYYRYYSYIRIGNESCVTTAASPK